MTDEVNPVRRALEERIRSGVPQHVDWENYVPKEDDTPDITEAVMRSVALWMDEEG